MDLADAEEPVTIGKQRSAYHMHVRERLVGMHLSGWTYEDISKACLGHPCVRTVGIIVRD